MVLLSICSVFHPNLVVLGVSFHSKTRLELVLFLFFISRPGCMPVFSLRGREIQVHTAGHDAGELGEWPTVDTARDPTLSFQ
jgi:hypothetical protein